MGIVKDLSGQRFGRLVAKSYFFRNGKVYWHCLCDCGKEHDVSKESLVRKDGVRSCGCLQKDIASANVKKYHITHGKTHTRLYGIWKGIVQRCENQKNHAYDYYGGRGIMVCREWRNNSESFIEWAESNGYNDKLTLDRIDTNGNYEPSNCRWVSIKQQGRNRRNNIMIRIGNEEKALSEWCELKGLNYDTVRGRIRKGMDPTDAVLYERRSR